MSPKISLVMRAPSYIKSFEMFIFIKLVLTNYSLQRLCNKGTLEILCRFNNKPIILMRQTQITCVYTVYFNVLKASKAICRV